jgi:hypothetical protein
MSHELSRKHQDQIAEKAAIIANTAFTMGRDTETTRIKQYITEQLCEHCTKGEICDDDHCYLLKDVIAFINTKPSMPLGDTNAATN